MSVEVRPVPIPAALGTPEAAELEAYAELGFALERANWGHDHFADSAARLLAMHRHAAGRGHAELTAWDGADIVGRAGLAWELTAGSETVELTLGVLPSHRRRGVGSVLLAAAEQHARELGRATVVAYSDHPDDGAAPTGPVVRAPDGDAELAASVPAHAFAEAHGYSLGQLERISSIRVPGRIEEFRAELGERVARAGGLGYRLVRWTDRAPAGLVDAYAAARARMALDVPAGGLTIDEEHWDAARVREHESRELDSDTSLLVSAAVTDDGEIAGYTELELPRGRGFAYQYDTLVVGAHRGNGLGTLVKLANLVRLADVAPDRTVVYTWNADENAHMLAINVALGFRRCGLEAVWQRTAAAEPPAVEPPAVEPSAVRPTTTGAAAATAGSADTGATTGS